MKILTYEDLKPAKGIRCSKVTLWRWERRGEFPRRVPIGPSRYGWLESEIDAWLKSRVEARDAVAA